MAELQKEIHSPSAIPAPLLPNRSFPQPLVARRFVPRNDFASRAEIFVPGSVARDATSHGSFFSFPAIVFVRCGTDQRGNISSFEGFLMYSRISAARSTSRCELSQDGWTRDEFSEMK